METQTLHRGRLIDHFQLVVKDLEASKRFYKAVLGALGMELGDENKEYFRADELFVLTADSRAAQGKLTGRCPPRLPGGGQGAGRGLPQGRS